MTRPIFINLGLCRTGGSSLRRAMALLGYSVQSDPYQRARLELLFAGKAREAMDRDIAAGHDYLSEPYYAFAPAVLACLRPDETPIVTMRTGPAWLASVEKRAAKAHYSPVPPWMRVPFTAAQQMLLWLWRKRVPSEGAAQKAWEANAAMVSGGKAIGMMFCEPNMPDQVRWGQLREVLTHRGYRGPWPPPGEPFPLVNASQ